MVALAIAPPVDVAEAMRPPRLTSSSSPALYAPSEIAAGAEPSGPVSSTVTVPLPRAGDAALGPSSSIWKMPFDRSSDAAAWSPSASVIVWLSSIVPALATSDEVSSSLPVLAC
jgi:hypothetical protein